MLSATSIVRRLCVITMNCVRFDSSLQRRGEPSYVRLIEHRVHFVQHAERRWVRLQQREEERNRLSTPFRRPTAALGTLGSLPRRRASISTPEPEGSFGSVRLSLA